MHRNGIQGMQRLSKTDLYANNDPALQFLRSSRYIFDVKTATFLSLFNVIHYFEKTAVWRGRNTPDDI